MADKAKPTNMAEPADMVVGRYGRPGQAVEVAELAKKFILICSWLLHQMSKQSFANMTEN